MTSGAPSPGTGILANARAAFGSATNSLVKKIIWLTFGAALFSATILSVINYLRLEETVREQATEKLAGQTRMIAQSFKMAYEQMESDVRILSLTPPSVAPSIT